MATAPVNPAARGTSSPPRAAADGVLTGVGWGIGAVLIAWFGSGAPGLGNDLPIFVVAFLVAAGVPTAGAFVLHRRGTHPSRGQDGAGLEWAICTFLLGLTLSSVEPLTGLAELLSALQIWLIVGAIWLVATAAGIGLRPLKLAASELAVRVPPWVGPALIAVLLAGALVAVSVASHVVSLGQTVVIQCHELAWDDCMPYQVAPPVLSTDGLAAALIIGAIAVAARFTEARRLAPVLIGALYALLVIWSGAIWEMIRDGELRLPEPSGVVLALQVGAGAALLLAIIVGGVFPESPRGMDVRRAFVYVRRAFMFRRSR